MNNVMSMKGHKEMVSNVVLINAVLEKSFNLQDNVRSASNMKESYMIIRFVRSKLVVKEKSSVMMVNAFSVMNLKDSKHLTHVDLIHALKERSSSHQVNANHVKIIPFYLMMVRAVSLHHIQ